MKLTDAGIVVLDKALVIAEAQEPTTAMIDDLKNAVKASEAAKDNSELHRLRETAEWLRRELECEKEHAKSFATNYHRVKGEQEKLKGEQEKLEAELREALRQQQAAEHVVQQWQNQLRINTAMIELQCPHCNKPISLWLKHITVAGGGG